MSYLLPFWQVLPFTFDSYTLSNSSAFLYLVIEPLDQDPKKHKTQLESYTKRGNRCPQN